MLAPPQGVVEWAVGVTTAPREKPTLDRCLESLTAAGWPAARVFAEPGVELPHQFPRMCLERRESRLGAWLNWFSALGELVRDSPQAQAIMMVQDDTLFCRNVRLFLERVLWPSERTGMVSIYCPPSYAHREGGFHSVDAGAALVGALATIFPAAAARTLLNYPVAIEHHRLGPPNGQRGIDSVIGQWAQEAGLTVYYYSPSLAQHIGDTSTIWEGAVNWDHRRSRNFVGDAFDATRLCPDRTSSET